MVAGLTAKHGLQVRRGANGFVQAVNIVHYDRLRGTFGDSAQQRGPAPPSAPAAPPSEDTLDGARIAKLREDIERQRLDNAETIGRLVRRDAMAEAVTRLGEELAREVDITRHADRIAAAAQRGLHALRIELKAITAEIKTGMADHCARVALVAPLTDDLIKDVVAA